MSNITKEHALNIAKKLHAAIKKRNRGAHDLACIYHKGKLIASFGIRRCSSKDLGHDHIPGQIYLNQRDARLLGICPFSEEDWLNNMREKGLIN